MEKDRLQEIKTLRKKRFTLREIGAKFGISNQRVYKILKDNPQTTKIPKNWRPRKPKKMSYNKKGLWKLGGRGFLREQVRRRDDYTCQICGKKWQEGQRRLDVHHIDKEKEGRVGRACKNNKCFDRMITLCHKCHINLEHIKEKEI